MRPKTARLASGGRSGPRFRPDNFDVLIPKPMMFSTGTPYQAREIMADRFWLGVDLGGTKILAGVFTDHCELVARAKQSTDADEGGAAVFGRIVEAADSAIRQAKIDAGSIAGLGLAVPGQIVPDSTIVRFAPNLGWRDFDLTPLFPAHWKWPVAVENDVRMGTYGEWKHGAAKGARHVFGIFAGTGVGGGLILDGKLYHGFNGHAGEIGHIIIGWKAGTELEEIAGRKKLMARATKVIDDSPKSIRKNWKDRDPTRFKSSEIAEFVENGDPVMNQLVDEAARAIAAGVGSVVNLLSPEVVVIGGGMTKALGASFPERIWEIAQRYALPRATENVRCVMSALGDDAGITGAAAFVKEQVTMKGTR